MTDEATRMRTETIQMPGYELFCNSAKGAMIGEFKEYVHAQCDHCDGLGEDAEGLCQECNSSGEVRQPIPVEWTTIKDIYKRMTVLFGKPQPAGRTDSERLDWLIACVIAADRNVLAVHETLAAYGQFSGAAAVTDALESMRSPFNCNLTQEDLTRAAIDAAMDRAKAT